MAEDLFIGLMSGTSLDGVDGVLADFAGGHIAVKAHATTHFPVALRAELLALNLPHGDDELHRAALAGNGLARIYAAVVQRLLTETGLPPTAVRAIGAHGQTVRHRPGEFDETGYTLQINNPAALAEWTGIDVVADFRSRDVAAGGQGAPLVPAFHRALFGHPDQSVAVLNIGGIANLSLLPATRSARQTVLGFDCGPGNALMDHWCQSHIGEPFDRGGQWAASGVVLPELLDRLIGSPYFGKAPPKSTGRDLFNPAWLATHLGAASDAAPIDVQATLAELTASACAADVQRHGIECKELIVCGGGALNDHLMARLRALLPGLAVVSSSERGLPPQQVEAAAFAWLARAAIHREQGNLASVTGARGGRVLGGIYPA
ncbi:anhydro-N-acetylmuramic acid kinase [Variovorax rhizosphaerae]|uniref:Anhydro-N-acetylmuramic acid kinase n=1 Tax=Variovorax rhizosphaerae TaxID=1836200 RepID=A0ABU8WIE6_9BURK